MNVGDQYQIELAGELKTMEVVDVIVEDNGSKVILSRQV
jgi:hypothetical protein